MVEAHFASNGIQNFHSHHWWADKNPHAILPSHNQQQFTINILTGILGDNLFENLILVYRAKIQNFLAKQIFFISWTTCC
jgi:hypothetical protein